MSQLLDHFIIYYLQLVTSTTSHLDNYEFFFDDFCILIVEIFVHELLIWSFVIGANSFFKFDRLLDLFDIFGILTARNKVMFSIEKDFLV